MTESDTRRQHERAAYGRSVRARYSDRWPAEMHAEAAAERPFDRQLDDPVFADAERHACLVEHLSRASPKISTLDVTEARRQFEEKYMLAKTHDLELDRGL